MRQGPLSLFVSFGFFSSFYCLKAQGVLWLVLPTRTRKNIPLLGYGFYPLKGKHTGSQNVEGRRRRRSKKVYNRNRWWWWRRWRSKPHGQQFLFLFLSSIVLRVFFFFSPLESFPVSFPFFFLLLLHLFFFFNIFYWVNFTVVDRLMAPRPLGKYRQNLLGFSSFPCRFFCKKKKQKQKNDGQRERLCVCVFLEFVIVNNPLLISVGRRKPCLTCMCVWIRKKKKN